jgi:sulfate/thiosulfate transport system permease protein
MSRSFTTPAALMPAFPGLALRAGVAAYVLLLVALPLGALVHRGLADGLGALWVAISAPAAVDALLLTLWTAALMAAVNAVMGTATAWVLVRFRFPGRSFLSTLVDLPFAIPTLVAGIMLVLLFGPQQALGAWLASHGVSIVFAPPVIVLALLFITVPFVVRAVEPVLLELDLAEEEAARTLGASEVTIFVRVILPALVPAIAVGTLQCFARALAEFGSIVVVSGNIPHRTLTAAVLVFGEVESGEPGTAAAISIVLLASALSLSLGVRALRTMRGRNRG